MKQRLIHEHCLSLKVVNFYPKQSHLRCGSWLRLQLLQNFCFHGTLVSVFIRSLIFCKSAAVINHKFQGTQILLNIQKQSHRDFLQTCNEFTGEHPRICVVFINLNCRFGCSPVNLLHICRIPFAILSENLWETVCEYELDLKISMSYWSQT